jgi:Lipase (class 3)
MRKPFSWICGILAVLASQPANSGTNAAASGPDLNRAYVLATASYCAYAVGAIDSDGERLADKGRQRALDCLMAAVEADPSRLAALKVEDANVEAYFSPAKPQNAYLLIRARNGVILAFRGTLTLPISPGKASHNGLMKEVMETFNVAVLKAFESYLRDWANNVAAFADERDRHAGFDHSWQELKEHLKIDCGPGAAEACSKFRSFIAAMGANQQLLLTGHSKGGALATLASLDMPEFFEHAPQTTVYTFAAPKSLSQEGAEKAANATADLWRFEDERDVVPTLPLDRTGFPVTLDVPLTEWKMAPYAHVGRRVLFRENEKPAIFPEPVDGLDPPGDLKRLKTILRGGVEPAANNSIEEKGLLRRILSAGADGCRRFLDTHFSVFSSVQAMARAGELAKPGPGADEEAVKKNFFFSGVSNAEGEILWGYGQWCSLLYQPK